MFFSAFACIFFLFMFILKTCSATNGES
uniref:Uncharacterized protein n=1 Tax=Rhizophora mucronata TaxID=61149 RepID=A0A2P2QB45_RHIMU